MSENKKPRLAEVLGVEVEEKFYIRGSYYNPYFVNNEGVLIDGRCFAVDPVLSDMINHPELIECLPRWTEQEIEDAKNIIRMFGEDNFTHVVKDENGWPMLSDGYEDCATFTVGLEKNIFPSLKPEQTVKLTDIIGGNE